MISSTAFLRQGRISDSSETYRKMVTRVVATLDEQNTFNSNFKQDLTALMLDRKIVFSTPIMTNAGRNHEKPLSACMVPNIDFNQRSDTDKSAIRKIHEAGMGTGYDLSECEDPVNTLYWLNDIAITGANSGREERPVGNMATLDVRHPEILSFIACKLRPNKEWKFNISVRVDDEFMELYHIGAKYRLYDGTYLDSGVVVKEIAKAAKECADPGLIFMDRMNKRNPCKFLGEYKTTSPCAEVGLIEGEICQFGYVNIAKFIETEEKIDLDDLNHAVNLLVQALDHALEASLEKINNPETQKIMRAKRKIGVGICGLADMLIKCGLPYDSSSARILTRDLVAYINFTSKKASYNIAKQIGSCHAINDERNSYLSRLSYLEKFYANDTRFVLKKDWEKLGRLIKSEKILRNLTTIAMPPTGRSALVIGASQGIEPRFSMDFPSPAPIPNSSKYSRNHVHKTAKQIAPIDHILMAASIQQYTDDAISKTINLPKTTSVNDVEMIIQKAWHYGMSGITVYVDGSCKLQPIVLKKGK